MALKLPTWTRKIVQQSKKQEHPATAGFGTGWSMQRYQSMCLRFTGKCPLRVQMRILLSLLTLSLISTLFFLWLGSKHYIHASLQMQITSDLLMHSQRIGKIAPNAIRGHPEVFNQLRESHREFSHGLNILTQGGAYQGYAIRKPEPEMRAVLTDIQNIWDRSDKAASTIIQMQPELLNFGATQAQLRLLFPNLLSLGEQIWMLQSYGGNSSHEVAVAGQLVMLTLHLGRGASEFLTLEGINQNTAFSLSKDISAFRDIVDGFLNGSEIQGLSAVHDKNVRDRLNALKKVFGEYQRLFSGILDNLQDFIAAKQSEQMLFLESEALRRHLSILQNDYRSAQETRSWTFWMMLLSMLTAQICSIGIARIKLQSSRRSADKAALRYQEAEAQRRHAQQREECATHINTANQAAILHLMHELQKIVDGDLTVRATVSEGIITGEIAGSVNRTVEAFHELVNQVMQTASQVAQASIQARETAQELSNAGQIQARHILDAGESMLEMSTQITDVSISSSLFADVARHSVAVAECGVKAVADTVKGMHEIHGQIQEICKRTRYLGESSQEISDIIELVSDMTEQANVLAINASIQAASAGEAGRGFSVVAEEAQRLAERSGTAIRQIGALVRIIQSDAFDVAAAMEKSSANVVAVTRLSDSAAVSLCDIRNMSGKFEELVQDISLATDRQVIAANSVAQNIQSLLGENHMIEQRREKGLSLFDELHDLAGLLKNSVSRFRVMIS
ncbi:MAG: methyl-accepting chemotaxis protein [Herbaspirillum sp.]